MRHLKIVGVLTLGACVALAGHAAAQPKGSGKSSITIVKIPAPAPTPTGATPKTAGTVSAKPVATVAGKPPTAGGSFAIKLAKEIGDATKPGFAAGEYVLEIESAGTPSGNLVGDALSAAFFITLTVDAAGKCTIRNNPAFSPPNCGGDMQPACALAEQAGKCSAQIYQVAGNLLAAGGLVANQPFAARFRLRANPDPANCKTGHLFIQGPPGVLAPANSTCRTGAVLGVGGVALGAQ